MRAKTYLILGLFLMVSSQLQAQCAMCKTTIVNNVSNGELALAEGLNFGIMYLFFAPYIVFGTIAGVWFYQYRKHGKKLKSGDTTV